MNTPAAHPVVKPFTRVAVIGAGVMGAGIAAQVANAGMEVLLLDRLPDDKKAPRDAIAAGAIDKLKKSNPAALMHPGVAARITPGNVEDDLPRLAGCDWIIEVVLEDLEVKRALYRRIIKHRAPQAIVSSNTSTLPLALLLDGLPKDFRQHFLVTHFFNPPRYMRLLEVVGSPATKPEVLGRIREVADHLLGKSVVTAKDTPGFIANRIGTFWLHAAVLEAQRQGVTVEEADAVLAKPFGIPSTGVFGLLDLVGIDTLPHILSSLAGALPKEDAFHQLGAVPKLLPDMVKAGLTGRKGKGGFYRLNERREKEVLNLETLTYAAPKKPRLPEVAAAKKDGPRALLMHSGRPARYARHVMLRTLLYAVSLADEIADDIETIDRAMRLGYNWKYGPFELIDRLGAAWFAQALREDGLPVPFLLEKASHGTFYRIDRRRLEQLDRHGIYKPVIRAPGVLLLEDVKRRKPRLFGNLSASVWDVGDGVACVEFHSKMNTLDPLLLHVLRRAVRELPGRGFKGIVIHNNGGNFSVGANIFLLKIVMTLHIWPALRWFLRYGQGTMQKLKYASIPVVGAPSGMALGGAAEILMHCHALTASAESYIGLVEAGVGIIPAWAGSKELLGRLAKRADVKKGPMPAVIKAFETIATAQVGKSAHESRDLGFLKESDLVVMNHDRLLAEAKALALTLADGFKPQTPHRYRLPGPSGAAALKLALNDFRNRGLATAHDAVVGTALAGVLTGGGTDVLDELHEDDLLRLEREAFMTLAKTPATRDRVTHMLRTGKPLRN